MDLKLFSLILHLALCGRESFNREDLDYTPFNQEGGLGKARQLFGGQLPKLLEDLNEALAA